MRSGRSAGPALFLRRRCTGFAGAAPFSAPTEPAGLRRTEEVLAAPDMRSIRLTAALAGLAGGTAGTAASLTLLGGSLAHGRLDLHHRRQRPPALPALPLGFVAAPTGLPTAAAGRPAFGLAGLVAHGPQHQIVFTRDQAEVDATPIQIHPADLHLHT